MRLTRAPAYPGRVLLRAALRGGERQRVHHARHGPGTRAVRAHSRSARVSPAEASVPSPPLRATPRRRAGGHAGARRKDDGRDGGAVRSRRLPARAPRQHCLCADGAHYTASPPTPAPRLPAVRLRPLAPAIAACFLPIPAAPPTCKPPRRRPPTPTFARLLLPALAPPHSTSPAMRPRNLQGGIGPVSTSPFHSRGHVALNDHGIDLADGAEHSVRIVFEKSRYQDVRAAALPRWCLGGGSFWSRACAPCFRPASLVPRSQRSKRWAGTATPRSCASCTRPSRQLHVPWPDAPSCSLPSHAGACP